MTDILRAILATVLALCAGLTGAGMMWLALYGRKRDDK